MSEQIESSEEFMDGISPECRVVHDKSAQPKSTIELHTPTGVRHVELPDRWSMHDLQVALDILRAVNYDTTRPQSESAVVAYRPTVPRAAKTGEL